MNRLLPRVSVPLLLTVLLGGTAIVSFGSPARAATDLQAQTGWAISRVASATQGSYCTMAQKFSNGTVFTVARNARDEYSLAFDFQSPKFKSGEKMAVSLKSGPGGTQSFEVTPQSPEAFVIGLGDDASLVKAISKTGQVLLDVAGESLNFNTAKFSAAEEELTTCMASMQPHPAQEAKKEAPVDAASLEAGEKSLKNQESSVMPENPETAAGPRALQADDLIAAPVETAAATAREMAAVAPAAAAAAPKSVEKQAIAEISPDPRLAEMEKRVQMLESENAGLKEEQSRRVEQDKKQDKAGDEAASRLTAELTKASEENKALQAELVTARQAQRDLEALKSENQTLKNQARISQEVTPAISADSEKKLSQLQAENADLKARLAQPPQPATPVSDPEAEQALRDQMRDLKAQLELIESENKGLKTQIANLQSENEKGQLKQAGGSWDLEQATRRYQESQREIRRLGALLEQDRAKCQQEKKDIEYMLFDPEVAKPAQITMLNSLEDQLAEKDAKIAELQARVGLPVESPAVETPIAAEKLLAAAKPEQMQPSAGDASADILPVPVAQAAVKAEPLPPVAAELPVPTASVAPVLARMPATLPVPSAVGGAAPAPVAAVSPRFRSQQDFDSLLQKAGIGLRGKVQPVSGVASTGYKAFSWQTDSLYGSAEQRTMSDPAGFEAAVQQYVDRARSRCKGEFAAVPGQVSAVADGKAAGLEIACLNGKSGSSASVLFSYSNGVMTTVAHEGRAEAMDIAMDARDKVAARIKAN